jgi:hypothetical protein
MPFERSGYFRGASRRGAKKEDHPFGWSSFLVHQSNPNSNPFPPRPRAQRSGSRPKKEKGPRPAQFAAKAGNGAVRGPFDVERKSYIDRIAAGVIRTPKFGQSLIEIRECEIKIITQIAELEIKFSDR